MTADQIARLRIASERLYGHTRPKKPKPAEPKPDRVVLGYFREDQEEWARVTRIFEPVETPKKP